MLFDRGTNACTDAITNNGFSLFGMTTSDSINAIIAAFAVLGFAFSILALCKSGNQFKKQHDVSLFTLRYELYEYLLELFSSDIICDDVDLRLLVINSHKLELLFKDTKELASIIELTYDVLTKKSSFPDLTDKYRSRLLACDKDVTIINAYSTYAMDCVTKLEKQLTLVVD